MWPWNKIKFKSLQEEFNYIRYKTYGELKEREKRLLYAWLLFNDGCPPSDASSCATTNRIAWIDDQLKTSFGFSDNSIIQ